MSTWTKLSHSEDEWNRFADFRYKLTVLRGAATQKNIIYTTPTVRKRKFVLQEFR